MQMNQTRKLPLLLVFMITACSFTWAQNEDRVDRKVEVVTEVKDGQEEISVKITENGNVVLDKTYGSREEMHNDPEWREHNLHGRSHKGWFDEGNIDVIVESLDGEDFSFSFGDREMEELHQRILSFNRDKDKTLEFRTESGTNYRIEREEDGDIHVLKDGKEVEIEDINDLDIEVLEDGTMIISEEGNPGKTRVIIGDHHSMIFGKDGEGTIEIFNSMMDTFDNFSFDIDTDVDWEDMDVIGDDTRVIIKRRNKVTIEILDESEEAELDEFKGANIEKQLQLEEVRYYPNPSDGRLNLRFGAKRIPTEIRVIDLMGKEVYFEDLQDFDGSYANEIDLSGVKQGMYLLQIRQGDRTWNRKLAIN